MEVLSVLLRYSHMIQKWLYFQIGLEIGITKVQSNSTSLSMQNMETALEYALIKGKLIYQLNMLPWQKYYIMFRTVVFFVLFKTVWMRILSCLWISLVMPVSCLWQFTFISPVLDRSAHTRILLPSCLCSCIIIQWEEAMLGLGLSADLGSVLISLL